MARKAKTDGGGGGLEALAARSISTTDFAALVGLSPEALRIRIEAGEIPKVGHGKLNFMAAVHAFFAGEKRRIAATRARALASPRVRYNTARADQIEAKMAREAKGLISREEAELAVTQVTAIVAEQVKVMLQKFPEVKPAEFSAMIQRLDDAVAEILSKLSSGDPGR